jgi:hypothetical protein
MRYRIVRYAIGLHHTVHHSATCGMNVPHIIVHCTIRDDWTIEYRIVRHMVWLPCTVLYGVPYSIMQCSIRYDCTIQYRTEHHSEWLHHAVSDNAQSHITVLHNIVQCTMGYDYTRQYRTVHSYHTVWHDCTMQYCTMFIRHVYNVQYYYYPTV